MQSVRVQWLDSSSYQVLIFQLDPNFTIKDYIKAVDDAWELLDSRPVETFYVVADVSKVERIPTTMITTMFKAYRNQHPAFSGLTILIGAPGFIQLLVGQFQNIFHTSKFGFARHIDDLDTFISQYLQLQ